jgi:hypothetical protein
MRREATQAGKFEIRNGSDISAAIVPFCGDFIIRQSSKQHVANYGEACGNFQ